MQTVAPGPYTVEEPEKHTNEHAEWDWNRQMFVRGLSNDWDLQYIKDGIKWHGLDVILHIAPLPFRDPDDFIWNLEWKNNPLWYKDYKLLYIGIEHGPAWVEFIASDFRTPTEYHYHVSLVYTYELKEWYDHLWHTHGREFADAAATQWFMNYQIVRERYDGKRARLKGRLTNGLTLQINKDCKVEGLEAPYILWDGFSGATYDVESNCDQDMLFVHTLPGNNFHERYVRKELNSGSYKSLQHMHVSLLLE
jgi:hypothetical protein